MLGVVVADVVGQEPVEPPARRRLSARRGIADLLLEAEVGQARHRTGGEPLRHGNLPRCRQHLPALDLQPGPVKRREDGIGAARLRLDCGHLHGVQALVPLLLHAGVLQGRSHALAAAAARRG